MHLPRLPVASGWERFHESGQAEIENVTGGANENLEVNNDDFKIGDAPPHVSLGRMFLSLSAFTGAQIGWSLQYGIATPTFRELGVSQSLSALIWLAGPVSGIVGQPIIGAWSDSCTAKLGRRRPFLLGATVVLIPMMLLFGHTRRVGVFFGDGPDASDPKPAAVIVAIVTFWVSDFAINAMMGPMRALTSDIFSFEQQAMANGIMASHNGLGCLISFGIGSVDLVRWSRGFFSRQVQGLAIISSVSVLICTTLTLVLAKEQKAQTCSSHAVSMKPSRCSSGICAIRSTHSNFPGLLKLVFVVQFLTSLGKNGAIMFVTDWFGEVVYRGNPQAAEDSDDFMSFEAGVRMGSLAMMVCGTISGLFGFLLPCFMCLLSKKVVWVIALSFGLLAMGAMSLFSQPVTLAFALVSCLGVALGARESIPWSTVTAVSKGMGSAGANTAVFNLSQSVPALMSAVMGSVTLWIGTLSTIFGICAFFMALSVLVILICIPADLDAAEHAAQSHGEGMPPSRVIGSQADVVSDAAEQLDFSVFDSDVTLEQRKPPSRKRLEDEDNQSPFS